MGYTWPSCSPIEHLICLSVPLVTCMTRLAGLELKTNPWQAVYVIASWTSLQTQHHFHGSRYNMTCSVSNAFDLPEQGSRDGVAASYSALQISMHRLERAQRLNGPHRLREEWQKDSCSCSEAPLRNRLISIGERRCLTEVLQLSTTHRR